VILLSDLPPEIVASLSPGAPTPSSGNSNGEMSAASVESLSDMKVVGRVLFRWASADPKLKIIPAVERELVIQALGETSGNQVKAAKLLGITRATLRKRIQKFGIKRELSIQ
jgi:two-component system nitrogen regulation response regulator GlnG